MFSTDKPKNINSIFAKFNSFGQLSCIICNKSIKNELQWKKHLNSKIHLEKRIQLESKIDAEKTDDNKQITTLKRDISKSLEEPSDIQLNIINSENKKQKLETKFDSKNDLKDLNSLKSNEIILDALPEGFYDDRIEEKNRLKNNLQNQNIEYQEFKRIIESEEFESENLKDDKKKGVEREIEEVEDLIIRWEKIEKFHCKREEILKKKDSRHHFEQKSDSESEVDESEIDIENILSISLQTKKRC